MIREITRGKSYYKERGVNFVNILM